MPPNEKVLVQCTVLTVRIHPNSLGGLTTFAAYEFGVHDWYKPDIQILK